MRLASSLLQCAAVVVLTLDLIGRPMAAGEVNSHQSAPNAATEASDASDQNVQWEPISGWDCTQPYEVEGFFFLGLFFAILISALVIRRKTRKQEPLPPKRFLQI